VNSRLVTRKLTAGAERTPVSDRISSPIRIAIRPLAVAARGDGLQAP
jgi:hypothetical protein